MSKPNAVDSHITNVALENGSGLRSPHPTPLPCAGEGRSFGGSTRISDENQRAPPRPRAGKALFGFA